MPTPIVRITGGDGRTIAAVEPDRKNVVRPDVAYIMDDMMKDVINRGTAAEAGAWGFKNVAGKTAFAGKTGTSRDGWFAGFTPELVVVVYVGFDNGDDLGMKGADSAMPIWADFVKEALSEHPDWNGDWNMPIGIRKAEIDIRNGALIRELDAIAATGAATPAPTPVRPKGEGEEYYADPLPPEPEFYNTNVPAEFRRVELFISGTVPMRSVLPGPEDGALIYENGERPSPSPTPLNETWQDGAAPGSPPDAPPMDPDAPYTSSPPPRRQPQGAVVTVMVCPVTGMRATSNCPDKVLKSFKPGTEPKEFCTFHR
jgi:membrane peptidoglycan carboxypeptidase